MFDKVVSVIFGRSRIKCGMTCLLLAVSCTMKWEQPRASEPQIVVEGWIEEGKPATVILTQLMPFSVENDGHGSMDLTQLPLRWATVTVSDGETEEILTGRIDNDYTPPYVYSGAMLLGESGRTYRLTVKYPGREVTAETTIPEKVEIEKTEIVINPENPDQYSIVVHFTDNPDTKDYYKVFTKVKPSDTRYYPSFLGNMSDAVLSDEKAFITVRRSFRHLNIPADGYSPFFENTETVSIKLARLPEDAFEFWTSFENEVVNGNNILFPSLSDLKTNIRNGRGIWYGYAADIVVADCNSVL